MDVSRTTNVRLNSAGHECTLPNELSGCPHAPSSSRMNSFLSFFWRGTVRRLINSLHFVKHHKLLKRSKLSVRLRHYQNDNSRQNDQRKNCDRSPYRGTFEVSTGHMMIRE
ncbi:hypothetical protein QQF64_021347 [Cirrhinus molitorella]|uniref:Uncharacterized protein n=1 Tax=Cirrhinus molitorella TaxID=172907 RepID=A0ABR3LBT4_9TELE